MSKRIFNTVSGGYISVGDERADRMVGSGFWSFDQPQTHESSGFGPELNDEPLSLDPELYPAEWTAEGLNEVPEGKDTPEEVPSPQRPSEPQERPDVSVVRAWAKDNNVPVSAKGRVAAEVYDQYAAAHKN